MTQSAKKLLIIDDHALFADGLSLILGTMQPGLDIAIANNATLVLNDPDKLKTKDLVLIDLHMPSMTGFSFLAALRAQCIRIPVAVVSGSDNKSDIERAISLGARGFIPKDSPSDVMLNAVTQLLEGDSYLPTRWRGKIDFITTVDELAEPIMSERQLQVLALMNDGLQNKQIATVLGISVSAVKSHIENTFKRMGVNNRTACVKVARERGLV